MSLTQVFEARSGRPLTSQNEEEKVLQKDRRQTMEQISAEAGIIWSLCHQISSEDLHMKRDRSKKPSARS